MSGFGSGPWGSTPWGMGFSELELRDLIAIRENVLRLFFDQPVYFSEVLDPPDGSNPDRYLVMPVPGTIGMDGLPARAVYPAIPTLVAEAGAGGQVIDLVLDRMMSPYPARYAVTVNGLRAGTGGLINPTANARSCFGLRRGDVPIVGDQLVARRDIANPLVIDAIGPNGSMGGSVYPIDGSGDYANDSGRASYRKRIFRRLFTAKGRFAHLPDYGAGVLEAVKTLATERARTQLAAECERQIRLEPETVAASVTLTQSPTSPGTWILRVRARANTGETVDQHIPLPAAT